MLVDPQFDRPFSIMTDACDVGVGAVLQQRQNSGIVQPVAYYSKKLNAHQRNYSTIEKEALSLLLAVQHFILIFTSPTVRGRFASTQMTIHCCFWTRLFLDACADGSFCYNSILSRYNTFQAGKNVVADTLSRAPVE